jgi:DNA-binding response OmpR family regulator
MHPLGGVVVAGSMDVLIVERDELIADVLAAALAEDGIAAATVPDENEAIDTCRAEAPRIVITSINRRGEDLRGIQIVHALRVRWPWLAAIYLAALWPVRLRRGALDRRERFLAKPVAMTVFVDNVRELLAT